MPKDMATFRQMKERGEPIAMLTCYDYPTALLEERAGVDVLLVGDSVGTNVLGYASEIEVTLADIRHHAQAVRRGVSEGYLLADLPYRTYEDETLAVANAQVLLGSGADGVKLEGVRPRIVAALSRAGIDVCAHIGLSMQAQDLVRVKGKTFDEARTIYEGAVALEQAGAKMMVLELLPDELAQAITRRLRIPTIGIGAGPHTDGQVLVVQDMLGVTARAMRHARIYLNLPELASAAFAAYVGDVRRRTFPADQNYSHMREDDARIMRGWLDASGG